MSTLVGALLPLLPPAGGTVALVGAGGKTSALFRLAESLLGQGRPVLLTTTTHVRDPRLEPFRPAHQLVLRPELEAPRAPAAPFQPGPGLTVLLSRPVEPGKAKGIHPSWFPELRRWPWILVEADGSRGLPLKAPAAHEPVLPAGADLVVGVLGLAGLGRPLDAATVHRPERFAAVTGCAPGEGITWAHLAALVRHPEGLFKGVAGPRALLLNQADRAPGFPGAVPADLGVARILLGTLQPGERVKVIAGSAMSWP